MSELTQKEKNKILAAVEIVKGGDMAVIETLKEFMDTLEKLDADVKETLVKYKDELDEKKGTLVSELLSQVEKVISVLISETSASLQEAVNESGEASSTNLKNLENRLVSEIGKVKASIPTMPELPNMEAWEKKVVEGFTARFTELEGKIPTITPVTAEATRDALETLTGEERLDAKAIKNLPQTIERHSSIIGNRPIRILNNGTDVSGNVTEINFVNPSSISTVGKAGRRVDVTTGSGSASPLTTKGDIYGYSSADARIPVGANGLVLTADSTQALGVKWGAVAGTGDVVGPGSSTDNAIARFDGTTGKAIQDSVVTIADTTGNMAGVGTVNTHTIPGGTSTFAILTNKLSDFGATTSAELKTVISDESGSGALVFANTPTLVTPVLGVATATTINKVTLTAPASGSTLTIIDGKTLTVNKTMSLTAADDTGVYTLPTGTKTLLATDGAGTSLTGIPYTLTGTANQVVLSAGTGNITFSTPQNIGTGSSPQFATIELGAASDTTLSRSSAGVLAVEGVVVDTVSATNTLTNKRITKRVVTAADATSITPNTDNADWTYQANTQSTGTLTINDDAGTPTNCQAWGLKMKSTNVQTFSWNAKFVGGTTALPTVTTGSSQIDYFTFIYDTVDTKWHFTGSAMNL